MGVVLVVEDDSDVAELTCRMIRAMGLECRWVATGQAALELLGRGFVVDLFVIDLRLPDTKGVVLGQRVVQQSDAPIIFTTGHVGLRHQPSSIPRSAFLPKPYEIDQLLEVVSRYLPVLDPRRSGWHMLKSETYNEE